MHKYIAFALAAVCAVLLSACADTENSVRDSSCGTVTENTAEEISSGKSFYDIVKENCEKYGARNDGTGNSEEFKK